LRVEVLSLLRGVGWPVASVILHFIHEERLGLIDEEKEMTIITTVSGKRI